MLELFVILVAVGAVLELVSLRRFEFSDRPEYLRRPHTDCTEPHSPVVLETVLTNRSRLPIFQLLTVEPLPQYSVLSAESESARTRKQVSEQVSEQASEQVSERALLHAPERRPSTLEVRTEGYEWRSSVYLGGRQILRRKTRIEFPVRGVYSLGEAELYHGDFIGFRMQKVGIGASSEIVVYPQRLENPGMVRSVLDFLGEAEQRHTLYEDVLSTRTYRDYTPYDPMKSISWKLSAKAGRLIVREFDRLADDAVAVVYDLSYVFDGDRERYLSLLEYGYSAVRTLGEDLAERGVRFRFFTNAHTPDRRYSYPVEPGRTPPEAFFELLGRMKSMALLSTAQLLRLSAEANRTLIYIGLKRTEESERQLSALTAERRVFAHRIYCDEQPELAKFIADLNTFLHADTRK